MPNFVDCMDAKSRIFWQIAQIMYKAQREHKEIAPVTVHVKLETTEEIDRIMKIVPHFDRSVNDD